MADNQNEMENFAITESRRIVDAQLDGIRDRSKAAIEILKVNFIIATIIIAAALLSGGAPRALLWSGLPFVLSALVTLDAYNESIVRTPYSGLSVTSDGEIKQISKGELIKNYSELIDDNKDLQLRLKWQIAASIFLIILGFVSVPIGIILSFN